MASVGFEEARSDARGGASARAGSFSVWPERFRDVVDVLASIVALVVLSPLLLIVAIVTKLDSPGPVLFRQERIGRNRRRNGSPTVHEGSERRRRDIYGRPFAFYKFRTMFADSSSRFPHLYDYSHRKDDLRSLPIKMLMAKRAEAHIGQAIHSWPKEALQGDDPRLTRSGRWLRRTSLDELPNLFNVLTGDMHLVGPRPDIAENIRHYQPHELRILDVKPGVTGLAQVEGRGLLSFDEINKLDLKYLEARSLWVDARILARTIKELVTARGAY